MRVYHTTHKISRHTQDNVYLLFTYLICHCYKTEFSQLL